MSKNFHSFSYTDYVSFTMDLIRSLASKCGANVEAFFADIDKSSAMVFTDWNSSTQEYDFNLIVNFNSPIFDSCRSKDEFFLTLVESIYHEFYHIMVSLLTNKENKFNRDALFSLVLSLTPNSQVFYDSNYEVLDEEFNASIYGLKKALEYARVNGISIRSDVINLFNSRINCVKTRKLFYNKYYLLDRAILKEKMVNKMIDGIKIKNNVPLLIDTIYNKALEKVKDVNELIRDFVSSYNKSSDVLERRKIVSFYRPLITGRVVDGEKVDGNYQAVEFLLKEDINAQVNELRLFRQIKTKRTYEKQVLGLERKLNIIKTMKTLDDLKC